MELFVWTGFIVFVLAMLALDLGVFHRGPHVISYKEALAWSGVWIGLALVFNAGLYFMYEHSFLDIGTHASSAASGGKASLEFLTGYVIEKSLSLDNIFVIALIFSYFQVPEEYQHRILFYGILGALIMRGLMIAGGAALIHRFEWIIYVFGAFLIVTSVRMFLTRGKERDPGKSWVVKLARKLYPVSEDLDGQKFFTRVQGKHSITPLFLVLLMVESSDVLFAVDSIPAIFGVTRDTFIVFTSNVFAILGLRSLYFALAGIMGKFKYLKLGLVFLLGFVGVKMLLAAVYHIPTLLSLVIIAVIIAASIIASLSSSKGKNPPPNHQP